MNYVTFQKHAAKLTKAKRLASRPALQGMHHTESNVVCTDSHRLYQFNQQMPALIGQTINPNTGETIDCNYPDTHRLWPDRFNEQNEWELKPVIAFLKAVKTLKIEHVVYENGVLIAASVDGYTKLSHTASVTSTVESTALNTVYLLEGLELLATCRDTATFLWSDKYRPVVLRDHPFSPIMEVLVLPIRLIK